MSSGRPSRWHAALLVGVAAACVLAPPLMQRNVHSPVRTLSVLVLFSLAPGVALLPILSRRLIWHELALVVGTSLACNVLIAQLMLWLGAWSPGRATWVVATASLLSVVAQLALVVRSLAGGRRSRSSSAGGD